MRSALIVLVLGTLVAAPVAAQSWSLLYTLDHPAPGPYGEFGQSLASVGDLDGDGTDDLAVVAEDGPTGREHLYLYSGDSGAPLYGVTGQLYSQLLPIAVASVGDFDGDAVPEIIVGAADVPHQGEVGLGWAWLFSGATGDTLRVVESPAEVSGSFGASVAGTGDLDGDSVSDYAVGEPDQAGGGRAYLFSGATGDTLRSLRSPNPRTDAPGNFGSALAAVADLDGDGVREIAVLAPLEYPTPFRAGRLYTFSGATGTLLSTLDNPGSSWYGGVLAEADDLTGDGIPDLLLGAREGVNGGDEPTTFLGRLYVVSGANGQIARTVMSPNENGDGYSGSSFATAVAALSGADGAGGAGFAAGEPRWASGRVHVFTAGGALVQTLTNPAESDPAWAASRFGQSLAALRSSDGGERLAVASSDYAAARQSDGRVYVYGRLPVASSPSVPVAGLSVSVSPNPARSSATLALRLAEASPVRIAVVDALGRVVCRLDVGALAPVAHRIALDVDGLPPGVYVVRVTAGDGAASARLVVAR